MENASKALIIAGAILISILLISVGIIVMNAVNKPIDQAGAQADSQAIEMFNARFTGYLGSGQSMQAMKSLINAVNSTPERKPTLAGITTESGLTRGKTYTAEAAFGADGYISTITITQP